MIPEAAKACSVLRLRVTTSSRSWHKARESSRLPIIRKPGRWWPLPSRSGLHQTERPRPSLQSKLTAPRRFLSRLSIACAYCSVTLLPGRCHHGYGQGAEDAAVVCAQPRSHLRGWGPPTLRPPRVPQ